MSHAIPTTRFIQPFAMLLLPDDCAREFQLLCVSTLEPASTASPPHPPSLPTAPYPDVDLEMPAPRPAILPGSSSCAIWDRRQYEVVLVRFPLM